MKKIVLLKNFFVLLCLMAVSIPSWAQSTITFDFEENTAHRTSGSNSYAATANTYTENGATISLTYADAATTGSPLTGSAHVIGRIAANTTNSPIVLIGPMNFSGTVTGISYNTKGVAAMSLKFEYSLNGTTWTEISGLSLAKMPTSKTLESATGLAITVDKNFRIRFTVSVPSTTKSSRDFNLDDIEITYIPTAAAEKYGFTLTETGETAHGMAVLNVGGSDLDDADEIDEGAEVTVDVAADAGYGYTITVKDESDNEITVTNDKFTMPDSDVTVTVNYYLIPTYTLTIETPEHGTMVVKNGDDVVNSGDKLAEGTVLTIILTPDDGYYKQNFQAIYNGENNHKYTSATTFTMVPYDVTLVAHFLEKKTVHFSINGAIDPALDQKFAPGESISFPSDIADIEGKKFQGWFTGNYSSNDTAPDYVITATMNNEDKTYYAVFASVIHGSLTTKKDVITASDLVATAASYAAFSDVSKTSDAKYAGQSALNNSVNIQLKSKDSTAGLVSTTSGGKLKSVEIKVASGSNTLNIYGSHSAYSSAADLYDNSKQGTLVGSLSKTDTYNFTNDFEYIGLRSNSGAIYLSEITITWETGTPDTKSNYTTIVGEEVTISDKEYATFSSEKALNFGATDISVYTVTYDNDGTIRKHEVEDGIVPANTAVMLYKEGGVTDEPVPYTTTALTELEDNDLVVSDGSATGADGKKYALSYLDSKLGFYKVGASVTIPEGKAYLVINTLQAAPQYIWFDSQTTGISDEVIVKKADETGSVYTLDGRKVSDTSLQKGIYVKNGRKFVVK